MGESDSLEMILCGGISSDRPTLYLRCLYK